MSFGFSGMMCFIFLQPDPSKCTAVGVGLSTTMKRSITHFKVHLANSDGDPCTTDHKVTAELKSIVKAKAELKSIVKAKVVKQTPAIYKVSYKTNTCGWHQLTVTVDGMPIHGSPFRVISKGGEVRIMSVKVLCIGWITTTRATSCGIDHGLRKI